MRAFTDGNGNDSTSAVLAYLAANRIIGAADLYLIGEMEDPAAVWLTNWDGPLAWPVWGTFLTTTISRGRITSQVGLKVDSMDITWSPRLTAFGTSLSTANLYQKALSGFFDNRKVRLWRTLMPRLGDANTLGAAEWFGGRIAKTEVFRGTIKFTVNSFLDIVNQKVPPNVITPSNMLSAFAGNVPVLADLEKSIPTFTVAAPSNSNVILGTTIQPTANKIYGTDRFILGFMVFLAGSSLAGYWSPIAHNQKTTVSSVNYNQFQVYASFPWAPAPGDQFYVSTQFPVDQATAALYQGRFIGFPYVPDPTTAI